MQLNILGCLAVIGIGAICLSPFVSAATLVADYGFNTDGNSLGWSSLNVTNLTTTGGFILGTASNNDPQLLNASTNLTLGAEQTWATVVFRVREVQNEAPAGTVGAFNPTGMVIQTNSTTGPTQLITAAADFSAVESGDGYFTVTADISSVTATTIHELRVDPIGGAASNSNSETNGNTFEIDFIRVYAVPEPASALLGGISLLALLRRRR